jgi:hypothetical protein
MLQTSCKRNNECLGRKKGGLSTVLRSHANRFGTTSCIDCFDVIDG